MSNAIEIRLAKTSESDTLTELAIVSKAYWGYSDDFMAACREELSVSADAISSESMDYYVAQANDELAGFYGLVHASKHTVELDALFVRPDFIGSGIGTRLLKHAILIAKQKNYRTLVVLGDPNAQQFYLKSGATVVGKQESGSVKGRYLPLFHYNLGSITT